MGNQNKPACWVILPSSLRMINLKTTLVTKKYYDPMLTKTAGYRDHECSYVKSMPVHELSLDRGLCKSNSCHYSWGGVGG